MNLPKALSTKHTKGTNKTCFLFVFFVPFVDCIFCLRIRFLMGCSFSEITLSNQMISRTMGRNNPIYGRFRQEHHLDKQLTPQETPTLLGLFRPTSGIKPNINYIMKHLLKHIILPNYEDASAIPSFRQGSPESRLQGCPKVRAVHGA